MWDRTRHFNFTGTLNFAWIAFEDNIKDTFNSQPGVFNEDTEAIISILLHDGLPHNNNAILETETFINNSDDIDDVLSQCKKFVIATCNKWIDGPLNDWKDGEAGMPLHEGDPCYHFIKPKLNFTLRFNDPDETVIATDFTETMAVAVELFSAKLEEAMGYWND